MAEKRSGRRSVERHATAACYRCDQHITQIRHPGPAEVRVAEAVDHTIAVVVAAAAVPIHVAIGACVRAELDQTIRHAGTREGVAVAAGADEGVHEVACKV